MMSVEKVSAGVQTTLLSEVQAPSLLATDVVFRQQGSNVLRCLGFSALEDVLAINGAHDLARFSNWFGMEVKRGNRGVLTPRHGHPNFQTSNRKTASAQTGQVVVLARVSRTPL